MSKHVPHFNIEKYAAYLDGNLPDNEIRQIDAFIESDLDMKAFVEANKDIDTVMDMDLFDNEPIQHDMDLQSIELPSHDAGLFFEQNDVFDKIFPEDSDSYDKNESLYYNETVKDYDMLQHENKLLEINKDMYTNYRIFGESGENIYDPLYIKQPNSHACGLKCQQIILRDYGIDIPFDDLEQIATNAGFYSENGTLTRDLGKVLEMADIGTHQIQNGTIYDLTNELAQGHRVIVSLDSHELWYNDSLKGKLTNWFTDVFGNQGGNHALIVAGIEVNPHNVNNDVKVVLTDSGSGHLRIEYPLNQFMDAWKDSNCFMVATDVAAPFQFDATSGMEVPSNFASEYQYNQFVLENGYLLSPNMINHPIGYNPAFMGHLDMVGDTSYEDFLFQHLSYDGIEHGFLGQDSGESTGGVGAAALGEGTESCGSVGSGMLGEDSESSGSIGLGILSEGTESTGSVGLGDWGDPAESTGSVGSEMLGEGFESAGSVGMDILPDDDGCFGHVF